MEKDEQNVWYFLFSLIFLGLFFGSFGTLLKSNGTFPSSIGLFDAVLIALAAFRLTRLVTYDAIMQFFRDFFLDVRSERWDDGSMHVVREKVRTGPRRTIGHLIACPWCFGLWAAWMTVFFYYLTPLAWYPILVLAMAGVVSLLQIIANAIGWKAEMAKNQARPDVLRSEPGGTCGA